MITTDEHAQIALRFLDVSDEEFAEGKRMQASEKLWGAASQSVIAVAQQRGWDDSSHKGLKDAVRQLTQEHDDPTIRLGFIAAEKFHANFYHCFMDDFELEGDRPVVREFVMRMLSLTE